MGFPLDTMATIAETGLEDLIRRSVREEVGAICGELHRFVDRRIAELSMEVSASAQLMDFSEANLTGQLARIQEQIASVVAMPTVEARNSGLELESVVQTTESAANTIMEAAEAIDAWINTSVGDKAMLAPVTDKINAIFEACSFQDLTSQRIRRAIGHLQKVESMLANLVPAGAASAEHHPEPDLEGEMALLAGHHPTRGPDLAQDEIDKLMDF